MKVRKRKELCWQHGSTWHLLTGDEDGVWNLGLCARCLIEIDRDPQARRAFVARHYQLGEEGAAVQA